MAENLIIGTAGHVDHGKTTLIGALTGENTDRLEEEQERGLSIDLGFSRLNFDNGLQAGIIDVPGHEKFIKNMLAGAGGVDIGLLVVAADEAIMEQTREHLAILELLNVEQGVIAVTKSDKVDSEWLELVIDEIKEFVEDTFLEDAAVIPVSGIEETGIEDLKEELGHLMQQLPDKDKEANVYFPIDRVFSIGGHGTVVTGTLMQGQIQLEDELEIYPSQLKARVRGLQVHEKDVEVAQPGQRIGINLSGVDKDEIERGDVLAAQDSLVKTEYLDARLELIESAPLVLEHGERIRLHLGAKEVIGRVYLLDSEELLPGEEGLVQFRLEDTVVANFKERYVLRRYSPMTTIGGGKILEANPAQHRKNDEAVIKALQIKEEGTTAERIKLALQREEDKALTVDDLVTRTSLAQEQIREELMGLQSRNEVIELDVGTESSLLHSDDYQQLMEEIIANLKDYHQEYHLRLGMPKEELRTKLSLALTANEYDRLLDDLKEQEVIEEKQAKISLADFAVKLTADEKKIKAEIEEKFAQNKYLPPKLDGLISSYSDEQVAEEISNLLINNGELIKVAHNIYFDYQAVKEAKELLINYLKKNETIDVAQFRDLLDSSRKYALPLLEYFDQRGVTKREGDIRRLS
ncbi:selenocysteine-specific translation elongation factor [Halanaerobacter jeridensis]|uniref:Selenocysteine-specific elongation factor n=1 Tax=Halanaerobacter jeridensis TaxID=706427 RepID=A0A938XNG9_9FIRM|nr:selenocysteine-specific translation elongation factor [Halanaerobacter jeridensis]MBM7555733.1 selenocysteine-specific elongation factor [Halanaerobacter jeridensis]